MAKNIDTRARIRDTFLELYSKKSLENIRVTDICEALDISRGTFYYHYADVIAICEEIEDYVIKAMEDDLENTMIMSFKNQTDPSNVEPFIDAYSKSLEKYVAKQPIFYCLMNGSRGKQFVNKWIASVRRKNEINFNYINLKEDSQEWMGTFLAAGLVKMLNKWIDHGCKEDPRPIAETFARILFKGSIVYHK